MSSPTVSVVMSVFSDARYLHESMASILAQEGVDFEFIILDDGSTDESPQILDEYADRDNRVRVIHQANSGLTKALIRGCSESTGEFIARQDADDISLPGRLEKLVAMLQADPSLSFVSSQAQVIGPEGEYLLTHTRPTDEDEATHLLLHGGAGPPGHGSVMFRRSHYDAVGGYRPEFYYAQDCDLWYRLGEIGGLKYAPEVLYQYRLSPESVSGSRHGVKKMFAENVDRCVESRCSGESEAPILQTCLRLSGQVSDMTGGSMARTYYFLGRILLGRQPDRAAVYLYQCLRRRPWHCRAWFCLLAAPLIWLIRRSSL